LKQFQHVRNYQVICVFHLLADLEGEDWLVDLIEEKR